MQAGFNVIKQLVLNGEPVYKACQIAGIERGKFYRQCSPELLNEVKRIRQSHIIQTSSDQTAKIIETWVNNPDLTTGEIALILRVGYHIVTNAIVRYLPNTRGKETEVITLQSKV